MPNPSLNELKQIAKMRPINKLRDRFLKPKKKEIRRNLYEIEKKKRIFPNQK